MGMAASQARFLSLTARKSNVEYEGQQINQERTALANESSNLYAELTKLEVPAPPNTSDFYKTVYTFNSKEISGANTQYTLENIYSTPDGDFATLSHDESYFAAVSTLMSGTISTVEATDDTEDDDTLLKSGLQINVGDANYLIYLDDASKYKGTLDYLQTDNPSYTPYTIEGDDKQYLPYYMIGSMKYYLSSEEMTDGYQISTATSVKQSTKAVSEDVLISNYEVNDQGRTTSITVRLGEGDEAMDYTYELECTTVQDEAAYDQAMQDYEYYQAQYEKQVADINAKTEDIQQKDKTLELELKQLDTEQNAIATEMDSVSKVVEDNIESTFKTFA